MLLWKLKGCVHQLNYKAFSGWKTITRCKNRIVSASVSFLASVKHPHNCRLHISNIVEIILLQLVLFIDIAPKHTTLVLFPDDWCVAQCQMYQFSCYYLPKQMAFMLPHTMLYVTALTQVSHKISLCRLLHGTISGSQRMRPIDRTSKVKHGESLPQITKKIHPIARFYGRGMGYLLWVYILNTVLAFVLSCCVQCVIFYRDKHMIFSIPSFRKTGSVKSAPIGQKKTSKL